MKDQVEEKAVQLLATVQEQQEKESEELLISLNDMGVGQLSEVCVFLEVSTLQKLADF